MFGISLICMERSQRVSTFEEISAGLGKRTPSVNIYDPPSSTLQIYKIHTTQTT
jgi:hypothetical protein